MRRHGTTLDDAFPSTIWKYGPLNSTRARVEETASALGVSSDTVARDWKFANAWLRGQLDR